MSSCSHLSDKSGSAAPEVTSTGCLDCLAMGATDWAHLRQCLDCGHVACCDSSPHRHATAHFHRTMHPVIRSVEPGETWRWCYLDEVIG